MRLNETLQICLLALANRFPDHVVDINETLLGPQYFGSAGWTVPNLLEMLQHTKPLLLQENAQLIINSQKCEIVLPHLSLELPAIFVHCRGKMPTSKGNIKSRLRVGIAGEAIVTR
ncbi:MAG TPA: hypothetical protein VGN34_09580 [Ktedonobacteraceae bacterium]|jgi:hypothetical protein